MDLDDLSPRGPGDPLALLVKQDIDRLSLDELEARIAALKNEIARCQAKIEGAVNHRATAEGLFRR